MVHRREDGGPRVGPSHRTALPGQNKTVSGATAIYCAGLGARLADCLEEPTDPRGSQGILGRDHTYCRAAGAGVAPLSAVRGAARVPLARGHRHRVWGLLGRSRPLLVYPPPGTAAPCADGRRARPGRPGAPAGALSYSHTGGSV